MLVIGSPAGRPLLEEISRQVARRGAYALLRVSFAGGVIFQDVGWIREAPLDLLSQPASLEADALERCDAIVAVNARRTPEPSRPSTRSGCKRSRRRTALRWSESFDTRFPGLRVSSRQPLWPTRRA